MATIFDFVKWLFSTKMAIIAKKWVSEYEIFFSLVVTLVKIHKNVSYFAVTGFHGNLSDP